VGRIGRFPHQRTGGSSRRKTEWGAGPFSTETAVTVAGTFLWSTGFEALATGITIVRIRGGWSFRLTSIATVDDGFEHIGVGIGIVSADAFAVGVTAIPGPITDIGWPGWIYHEIVTGFHGNSTTESWGNAGSTFHRGVIDTKAMRKIGVNETIVGVFEVGVESGTVVAEFAARTRMLTKLS